MTRKARIAAACFLALGCLMPGVVGPGLAGKKPAPGAPALKVGDVAPDFKLQYFDGHDLKDVSLKDYRGKKNVVLAFYVFAFTGG